MNLYPRSFLSLIVLGNVLVVLPLLGAVGYAALTVDALTVRSQEAMRQAASAASLGYALPEEMNHMERILRQYEVLRDNSLLDEYGAVRLEWQRDSADYAAIPLLAPLASRIGAMQKAEAAAHAGLGAHGEGLAPLRATLPALKHDLRPLLEQANQLVEAERVAFRRQAETLWQRLMGALLSALLLTGLLLWFGRRMVARLWSRFERAVLALGEGSLERRIRLRGPEDMQRVGRRLEWLRQRLVTLEGERTRVMRHTSHELKTPLAALREGASLLKDGVAGPLTQQQARIAGIMQTNVLRLQGLIDGLLRMQQANHAREHMETGAIRLDQLIEQTLATYQLAARDRQVHIAGTLAPLTVEGNGEALATLTGNLISNAIKFSPDGATVHVALTSQGSQGVLDVVDEGPGIGEEERQRVFEPFFRGAAAKGVPGVGLGLAIAHEFALAHRGVLEVLDRQHGAHFRARLPLARGTA